MKQKENAALRNAAQAERNARGQANVSAREHSTDARARQIAARRILSRMIETAQRNKQTRVLDALLELFAKWMQSV